MSGSKTRPRLSNSQVTHELDEHLEPIAQEYRREGYAVVVRPAPDQLPEFAADFGVDLLATRSDGNVLVQVKRDRIELQADPDVPQRAGITNSHIGWRYDLVITGRTDPVEMLLRNASESSVEELEESLRYAESLLSRGDCRAGFLFACSCAEAAIRRTAILNNLPNAKSFPNGAISSCYANGFLTSPEFELLRKSQLNRFELFHGYATSLPDVSMGERILMIARRLLSGNPIAETEAG